MISLHVCRRVCDAPSPDRDSPIFHSGAPKASARNRPRSIVSTPDFQISPHDTHHAPPAQTASGRAPTFGTQVKESMHFCVCLPPPREDINAAPRYSRILCSLIRIPHHFSHANARGIDYTTALGIPLDGNSFRSDLASKFGQYALGTLCCSPWR